MKCIFSLLTSRWPCLRRLYNQKPWECAYVSLLDYWPSIRKPITLLSLLCFSFLLIFWPVSAVSAQEPTPTDTLVPFYTTPTPRPPENYNCPDGIPEGWGQYEPDPTWLFHCSYCLPSESEWEWPEFDWGENPFDPPGESTPTPEPTETPDYSENAYLTHSIIDIQQSHVNYFWGQYNVKYTNFANQHWAYVKNSNIPVGGNYSIILENEYYFKAIGYGTSSTMKTQVQYRFECLYADLCKVKFVNGYDFPGGLTELIIPGNTQQDYVMASGLTKNDLEYHHYWVMEVTIEGKQLIQQDYTNLKIRTYINNAVHNDLTQEIVWGYGPGTYEDFLRPPSYCDSVIPLGSGTGDDDSFKLPGFWFGANQCFSLGGFTVPLEWLNIFFGSMQVQDWEMPGMQFCFQAIHFDSLTLFGLEINLDWMALAMAGVVLFRFLTRS